MPLCPVWTRKLVKVTKLEVGPSGKYDRKVVKPTEKQMLCGCKPVVYVRVHYAELSHYRRGEGKYDDVFGLCGSHAAMSGSALPWNRGEDRWRPGAVSGLRGTVERVEVVEMDASLLESEARRDKKLRLMASAKADFKRKMRQVSTQGLSVDDWRQVFEECVEEFVAESVMES
jgi:hypothetical protein